MSEELETEVTENVDNSPEPVDKQSGAKHMSADEWEAKGNDPADYKTPEQFKSDGVWMDKLKAQTRRMDEMQAGFDSQVQGLNQLHTMQKNQQEAGFANQLQALQARRDNAIDDLDRDGAQAAQGEIDQLHNQQNIVRQAPVLEAAPNQATKDPAIARFEQENPWVMQAGPKQSFANAQLSHYQGQGYSMADALSLVTTDMGRTFPDINPNREAPAAAEGGSSPTGKRGTKALAMGDLTREESAQYMPDMWKDEKQFLAAVTNARKG